MTSTGGHHRQAPDPHDPASPAPQDPPWWHTYPNTNEGRGPAREEIARRDAAGEPSNLSLRGFAASGDPLLHTHVVVANLLQGTDGRWGPLFSKAFYRQSLTAGYLYQAEMRQRLTSELGIEWTPVRKGVAEVDGEPPEQPCSPVLRLDRLPTMGELNSDLDQPDGGLGHDR